MSLPTRSKTAKAEVENGESHGVYVIITDFTKSKNSPVVGCGGLVDG